VSKPTSPSILRIGHSPDPDDAFMWYPLANYPHGTGPGGQTIHPKIDTGRYQFVHVLEDIQSLNQRSEKGELEITALSIHQYPYVADKYALTSCGSSMGDNYGPMIVARKALELSDLPKVKIAVPGTRTTAFLTLSLLLKELGGAKFSYEVVPFDQILPAVADGRFDAGLIIHEGQLTYAQSSLRKVIDLGQWWTARHKLPLPLGGNAIRRDLGDAAMREVCGILLASIHYALDHRDEAVAYALQFGRGMGAKLADQFVGMYVNQWTLDYGERGRAAVRKLLSEGARAGLVPDCGEIDFIAPMSR
jgi:1,4-dihydroxy-6-naphthoate synthase